MKLRHYVAAFIVAATLSLGLAGSAVAHPTDGFLCYGNVGSGVYMYGDGPGQGPVDWILQYNEQFRGHQTQNINGTFWSYGHSASSYPYDYWVRTGQLRC